MDGDTIKIHCQEIEENKGCSELIKKTIYITFNKEDAEKYAKEHDGFVSNDFDHFGEKFIVFPNLMKNYNGVVSSMEE